MIALCREHADKADNGAYTDEQLRRFKSEAAKHETEISGRFDWMRHEIVVHAGGTFFVETPVLVEIDGIPSIWFSRNQLGELMLNYDMPPRGRTRIQENTWIVTPGDVREIVSPPGGRALSVRYTNGDYFGIEYREVPDAEEFVRRFPGAASHMSALNRLTFPVTVASITDTTTDGRVVLHPDHTTLMGGVLRNNWLERCGVGFAISSPMPLFTEEQQRAIASAAKAYNESGLT
ncbi:MAG: hypothetical protein BGO47_00960 [Microbacterium sp. 67-17]|nr:MAG: hypothetical protein BGO47_00960 [Microbacterium sp. 67-17]